MFKLIRFGVIVHYLRKITGHKSRRERKRLEMKEKQPEVVRTLRDEKGKPYGKVQIK